MKTDYFEEKLVIDHVLSIFKNPYVRLNFKMKMFK